MRPELETYHQIDLFLKGELTGEELSAFQKRLLEDPQFAEEVDLQKQVHLVVEGAVYQDLRQQIKMDINKIDQKNILKRKIGYGIGLIMLLMSLGIYMFLKYPLSGQQSVVKREQVISSATAPSAKLHAPAPALDVPSPKSRQNEVTTEKQKGKSPMSPVERRENIAATEIISIPLSLKTSEKADTQPMSVPLPATVVVPEVQPADPMVCKGFKLEVTPQVEAACAGQSTGKVLFDANSIKGGKGPYLIGTEIAQKKMQSSDFSHLSGGEHVFYITDSKGCTEALHVNVPEEPCRENKFVLNIAAGETWQIPALRNEFTLTVLDRSGRVVYKQKSEDIYQHQWNGMNLNGSFLDSGLYIYIIEYSDGKKQSGQVSIVK